MRALHFPLNHTPLHPPALATCRLPTPAFERSHPRCIISRHLGTIAFGSAILTLIQLVRIVCEVIDRKTKDLQDSNLVLKLTIKCAKCCLTCFFETAKKITQ